MKRSVLLPVFIAATIFFSCSDNENDQGPLPFTIPTNAITLLERFSEVAVLSIESGNGWYTVSVKDESVVKVEPRDGDYPYGAFDFIAKSLGTTTVTITDITVRDSKEITVNVQEPGIYFMRCGPQIVIKPEGAVLPSEIVADITNNLLFVGGYGYSLSNGEKGIMNVYNQTGELEAVRTFTHERVDGKPYIFIDTDPEGEKGKDNIRKLVISYDSGGSSFSYGYFYGLTNYEPGTRMNFTPQWLELHYYEDLDDKYATWEGFDGIESLSVLYMVTYNFTGFRDEPLPEN